MKLLNNLKNRIALSVGLGALFVLISNLWHDGFSFGIYAVIVSSVVIYIPLTIIWAVISTFFTNDEKKSSEELLDD